MKKTRILALLTCHAALILAACGGSEGNQKNKSGDLDLDGALSKIESRRKSDPNASGGNKCLLDFSSRMDDLLTEKEVLNATGFGTELLETNYSKHHSSPEYHTLSYLFDNKRMQTIAGFTLPAKDNVSIQRIRPISLTAFQNSYRVITEEEDTALRDIIDDVADGNVQDADAKAAKEELDASGVDKEVVKDAMSSMADAFKEISKGYRSIEDLGDAAVWNIATKELTVLDNGVQFEVQVDVDDDVERNKTIAIILAKKILNKCN